MNVRQFEDVDIAVLIPCFNEELTVAQVVKDFKKELPEATIYVFDNNSTDNTIERATEAGAIVQSETRQGKGNVLRSMFRTIDADIYILVDGDSTYFAHDVARLIKPIQEGQADMVVGDRLSSQAYDRENKRRFHGGGNKLVRYLINKLYKASCKDILSGYRAFNRYFICNFPVLTGGFEIETEMTLYALDKRFKIHEVPIDYKDRIEGSESKLSTFSDGFKIIKTIAFVFKNYKPLVFFGLLSAVVAVIGLLIGSLPVIEYIQYRYVYKVPLAILAASLEILAALFLGCGLILDTFVKQNREQFELRLTDFYKRENSR